MLNEPASTRDDRPITRVSFAAISPQDMLQIKIRDMVAGVLAIEKETFYENDTAPIPAGMEMGSRLIATFEGSLLLDSEAAYDQLDGELATINHLPVFRETQPPRGEEPDPARPHTVHVIVGRINPRPRAWWPNLLLFIATVFSVLMVGTMLDVAVIRQTSPALAQRIMNNFFLELWRGLPYAASILLILGAHELGHYFAARRHRLAVTLPYFIPLPFLGLTSFGTMGAFIQLRQPMKNRKMLFDVGAAGPLAGLVFAIPILFIGLVSAQTITYTDPGVYEGDSIIYALAKALTFGRFLPDGRTDVLIDSSQLAWAGWTGLLVTALNLIPIGQLDGGHVLYSLIGERARRLYFPLLGAMMLLVFVADVWFLWVILLLFFGRIYATPLDNITPLDNRRRGLAIFTLIVFVLIFVPAPLSQPLPVSPPDGSTRDAAQLLPLLPVALVWLRNRFR